MPVRLFKLGRVLPGHPRRQPACFAAKRELSVRLCWLGRLLPAEFGYRLATHRYGTPDPESPAASRTLSSGLFDIRRFLPPRPIGSLCGRKSQSLPVRLLKLRRVLPGQFSDQPARRAQTGFLFARILEFRCVLFEELRSRKVVSEVSKVYIFQMNLNAVWGSCESTRILKCSKRMRKLYFPTEDKHES